MAKQPVAPRPKKPTQKKSAIKPDATKTSKQTISQKYNALLVSNDELKQFNSDLSGNFKTLSDDNAVLTSKFDLLQIENNILRTDIKSLRHREVELLDSNKLLFEAKTIAVARLKPIEDDIAATNLILAEKVLIINELKNNVSRYGEEAVNWQIETDDLNRYITKLARQVDNLITIVGRTTANIDALL